MVKTKNKKKDLTPKRDIIFKKIFGQKGNEAILKDFLEGILKQDIDEVELDLATEFIPEIYEGKSSRVDVRAKLKDGTNINVEIQSSPDGYSDERNLIYWSKIYINTLLKEKDYKKAEKTICIWIVDGKVYDFKKYHSKWKVAEEELRNNKIF